MTLDLFREKAKAIIDSYGGLVPFEVVEKDEKLIAAYAQNFLDESMRGILEEDSATFTVVLHFGNPVIGTAKAFSNKFLNSNKDVTSEGHKHLQQQKSDLPDGKASSMQGWRPHPNAVKSQAQFQALRQTPATGLPHPACGGSKGVYNAFGSNAAANAMRPIPLGAPIVNGTTEKTTIRATEDQANVTNMNIPAQATKNIPRMFYGTAWKKEETKDLVLAALLQGFRGIDTACQPRHYNESAVGEALKEYVEKHEGKREEIFVQTKYTPVGGQDEDTIPYVPTESIEDQVRTSVMASLLNLRVKYIDSVLLHSPLPTNEQTMKAYRTLEEFVKEGKIRYLGVSNWYDEKAFMQFYGAARIKPTFVQNRFISNYNFDRKLRHFMQKQSPPVQYQGFWTLTGNYDAVRMPEVITIAHANSMTPETLWYRFLINDGIIVLCGTQNHMAEDIEVETMPALTFDEVEELRTMLYRAKKAKREEF